MTGPIVLIDDDSDDQELISSICGELLPGYPIRNFYNGAEGLDYLMTTPDQPFLILCDMNMPVMNGIELLNNIQSNHFLKSKSIPFVILTTGVDRVIVQRSYDLGVQGFLKKPESIAKLRDVLRVTFLFWEACVHPNNVVSRKNRGNQ